MNILVSKDPKRMSAVLDFLVQMLEECEISGGGNYAETRETLGIEIQKEKEEEEEEKIIFYLVKCEALGGRCLLDYLYGTLSDRHQEKMLSICLSVSLMNHGGDKIKSQQEVIQNLQSGLTTNSEGLRNLIISAISQGKQDFIYDFLLEIPNTESKGNIL